MGHSIQVCKLPGYGLILPGPPVCTLPPVSWRLSWPLYHLYPSQPLTPHHRPHPGRLVSRRGVCSFLCSVPRLDPMCRGHRAERLLRRLLGCRGARLPRGLHFWGVEGQVAAFRRSHCHCPSDECPLSLRLLLLLCRSHPRGGAGRMCAHVCMYCWSMGGLFACLVCTPMPCPRGHQSGLRPAHLHVSAQKAQVLGKSLLPPQREPWHLVLEAVLTLPSSALREGRAWCPVLALQPECGLEGVRAQQVGTPGPALGQPAGTSGMH